MLKRLHVKGRRSSTEPRGRETVLQRLNTSTGREEERPSVNWNWEAPSTMISTAELHHDTVRIELLYYYSYCINVKTPFCNHHFEEKVVQVIKVSSC